MGKKRMKSRGISLFIICLAMAMIYHGIQRGEGMTVLQKAIRICMECIGIG